MMVIFARTSAVCLTQNARIASTMRHVRQHFMRVPLSKGTRHKG
jgi:hypothetical protein